MTPRCGSTLPMMSYGIPYPSPICMLANGHPGPHMDPTGAVWRNATEPTYTEVDLAHAVANERNAIIAFLQREMQANYDAWEDGVDPTGQERGIALSNAWNDIANGAHNQEDQ